MTTYQEFIELVDHLTNEALDITLPNHHQIIPSLRVRSQKITSDVLIYENDIVECESYSIHGVMYLLSEFLFLFDAKAVQKMISELVTFVTMDVHAYKEVILENSKDSIVNNSYNRNKVYKPEAVGLQNKLSVLGDTSTSSIIIKYYDNPEKMSAALDALYEQYDCSKIKILEQIRKASVIRKKIIYGEELSWLDCVLPLCGHATISENVKKLKSKITIIKNINDDTDAELSTISYNFVFLLKDTSAEAIYSKFKRSLLLSTCPVTGKRAIVFKSTSHLNKWFNNIKYIKGVLDEIDTSENLDIGDLIISNTTSGSPAPIEVKNVITFLVSFRSLLLNFEENKLSIGMTFNEVDSNIKIQKLYADGLKFIKKLVSND